MNTFLPANDVDFFGDIFSTFRSRAVMMMIGILGRVDCNGHFAPISLLYFYHRCMSDVGTSLLFIFLLMILCLFSKFPLIGFMSD